MIENIPQQSGAIGSMDIPSPGFFWMLRPWKQGKLATMDGKARFAEVSFVGKSRIRISPLVNYPRARIDRLLLVAPESNMFITGSGAEFHVADVAGKKTKSLVPFTGWHFEEAAPLILDLENGIINFRYLATRSYQRESNYQPYYNVIYDAKNDRVLYESPRNVGESHYLFYPVTPEWGMGQKRNYNGILETLLYNWKTHETAGNELTKKLTVLGSSSRLELGCNINFEERYLFTDIERLGEQKKVKITWDENYEDVTVTPWII